MLMESMTDGISLMRTPAPMVHDSEDVTGLLGWAQQMSVGDGAGNVVDGAEDAEVSDDDEMYIALKPSRESEWLQGGQRKGVVKAGKRAKLTKAARKAKGGRMNHTKAKLKGKRRSG